MIQLLLFTPFLMAALVVGIPLLVWAGLLSPLGGFGATLGAWLVGAGAGLLAGLIGVFRADKRPFAWAGLAVGVVLTGTILLIGARAQTAPIHDISTDLENPPPFTVATNHPDNAGRDLSYPHGHPDSAALQRENYPGLRENLPVWCDTPAEEVWGDVRAAAETMNWNVTWVNADDMLLEAEATSLIFRFVDDVVIRVQNSDDGCVRVDVRSTSRVGQSDLGANAARIAEFLGKL